MKKIIIAAFVAGLGFATAPAFAMPVGSADQGQNDIITQVSGGCGPGWHRGRFGGCRPGGGPGFGIVRPGYGYGYRRRCNRWGRCW